MKTRERLLCALLSAVLLLALKPAAAYSFKGTTAHAKRAKVALRVRTAAWLGKRVYVQMRAFKAAGGKTYYSRWSASRAVVLKK